MLGSCSLGQPMAKTVALIKEPTTTLCFSSIKQPMQQLLRVPCFNNELQWHGFRGIRPIRKSIREGWRHQIFHFQMDWQSQLQATQHTSTPIGFSAMHACIVQGMDLSLSICYTKTSLCTSCWHGSCLASCGWRGAKIHYPSAINTRKQCGNTDNTQQVPWEYGLWTLESGCLGFISVSLGQPMTDGRGRQMPGSWVSRVHCMESTVLHGLWPEQGTMLPAMRKAISHSRDVRQWPPLDCRIPLPWNPTKTLGWVYVI